MTMASLEDRKCFMETQRADYPGERPLADDLLEGAVAIGDFIGVPTRRALWLLDQRAIPADKLGQRWVASRRELRSFFAQVTAGSQARPSVVAIANPQI
jgi:hypothetical protein